ncbi:hypothetical protein TNCV_4045601 [Trichonephila clavipes]|nr:hypothetical protein TNCV_4045601 [Trichonephila clavipes]
MAARHEAKLQIERLLRQQSEVPYSSDQFQLRKESPRELFDFFCCAECCLEITGLISSCWDAQVLPTGDGYKELFRHRQECGKKANNCDNGKMCLQLFLFTGPCCGPHITVDINVTRLELLRRRAPVGVVVRRGGASSGVVNVT